MQKAQQTIRSITAIRETHLIVSNYVSKIEIVLKDVENRSLI